MWRSLTAQVRQEEDAVLARQRSFCFLHNTFYIFALAYDGLSTNRVSNVADNMTPMW